MIVTKVDFARKEFVYWRFIFKKRVSFDEILKLTFMPLASIYDEIGVVATTADKELVLRETDREFWPLCRFFEVDAVLPDDWYVRTEQGETFEISLKK